MRSAKLKRARQSLEAMLAVEGGEIVVLFWSPDIQKRSGQRHQFKVELAERLTAQGTAGSTSWTGRCQSSSASMNSIAILWRCSPIHVTRNHSLTASWARPRLRSPLGCNTLLFFYVTTSGPAERAHLSASRLGHAPTSLRTAGFGARQHDTPRARRSCILRRIH